MSAPKSKSTPAKKAAKTPAKKATPWPAEAKPETVLVLRTCAANLISHNGFKWPKKGPVSAPDWKPEPHCGNGLHGWLWGEGDASLGNWTEGAKWLVVEVPANTIVDLNGKVKFPAGTVVFCGERDKATAYLAERAPAGKCIIGGTATAGTRGTATAGSLGTATAGDGGTATAGECGTATAGDGGTATAGDGGTATAGDGGTATAGYRGTATAGECGVLSLRCWDGRQYRAAVFAVGENGIKPGTPYKLGSEGKPVEVKP